MISGLVTRPEMGWLGHVTYCLVFWCKGLLEILIGRSPWHNVSILSLLRPPYTNFGRGQKQFPLFCVGGFKCEQSNLEI